VYDNPANLFVAGFIGSPSMNFIPCRLSEQGGRVGAELETGNGKSSFLPLPHSKADLREWLGRELILGIRPEQIAAGFHEQESNPQIHPLDCQVQVLEPTGPDTLVFVRINDREVTCRVSPKAARAAGESMRLMVDMSKALLFDPDSEQRIGA
jgi:multiple sugar transport system ATP-binding protein